MTTFQVEPWSRALPELRTLFPLLWDEVALDKDKLRAECDEEAYAKLEALNMLHLVTARDSQGIIGYHLSFVMPHMHYKGAGLFAFTDMYFTIEESRKAGLGAKLLSFVAHSLRERGVLKAYGSHKIAHDNSALFLALAWMPCDVVYCKIL